jgi:signal transduction histidine kinase
LKALVTAQPRWARNWAWKWKWSRDARLRWWRCGESFPPWWWTKPWPSAIRSRPRRSGNTRAARLIREIRAALHRREREQALAHRAAAAAIEAELKGTVAGLLLHSQLALNGSDVTSPIADRLRMVASLAGNLRQQLSAPLETRGNTAL